MPIFKRCVTFANGKVRTIPCHFLKKQKQMQYMKTEAQNGYVAPEVKFVEVIVEEGILISGIVINDRFDNEKHIVDEVEEW